MPLGWQAADVIRKLVRPTNHWTLTSPLGPLLIASIGRLRATSAPPLSSGLSVEMHRMIASLSRAANAPITPASTLPAAASRIGSVRYKRYSAFEADLDKDALTVARKWHASFEPSQLPTGSTTYARSSGPGGQHVNKCVSTLRRHFFYAVLTNQEPRRKPFLCSP